MKKIKKKTKVNQKQSVMNDMTTFSTMFSRISETNELGITSYYLF